MFGIRILKSVLPEEGSPKWLFLLTGLFAFQGVALSQSGAPQVISLAKPDTTRKPPVEYVFQDDILKDTVHRYGIYRAFEEFRRNTPSITQDFVFTKTKPSAGKPFLEKEKNQLLLLDPKGRTSRVLDKIWGFCDSSGVYIYFEDTYQLGKRYNKLRSLDRYCYFVDEYYMDEKTARKNKADHGSRLIRLDYLLNINDGQAYEFTVEALRRILSKDPELLSQFEKEQKPGVTKYAYLDKFNQRNRSTIKSLKR
jgi:hypothetical protein